MRPIPGQPGLYLADFSVPAPLPPPPYTWSVPTGRPWVLGGAPQSATVALLAQVSDSYDKIKRTVQPLVDAVPFDGASYAALARRALASPNSVAMQITRANFALVCRAVLSSVGRAMSIAQGLLSGTPAAQARAKSILTQASRTLAAFDRLVRGATRIQRAGASVGLGWVIADDMLAALAVLAVGTVIFFVGTGYLIATISEISATERAVTEATEACDREAAAGHPCSGAEFQAAVARARRTQNEYGFIPNIPDIIERGQNMLFTAGMLVVGGLFAYAAWTAEPARRNIQERLRQSTATGLTGARAPKGTPTALNLWVMRDIFKGRDTVPNRNDATSIPHLRRLFKAGYIEVIDGGKTLRLTAAGRAAL